MTLKTRRYLYIFFIILFLIITPLLILYTSGYKFDNGFQMQKTGMLIIDSKPEGAKIYINEKIQQSFIKKIFNKKESYILTPAKIKGLLPGDYTVTIETENHWSWGKKLTIKPGESTFAEDIILFKKDLPTLLISGKFEKVSLSPNEKYIITQDDTATNLIDLDTEKVQTIAPDSKITKISSTTCLWSPENKNVIVNDKICSIENWESPKSLTDLIGSNIENIQWDIDEENNIYYISNNSIKNFDLRNNSSKTIIDNADIIDYLPKDKYLYYIAQENYQAFLNVWDINNKEMVRKINLPLSKYKFINENHKYLNILDTNNNMLHLINPFSQFKPFRETVNNITHSQWVDKDKLIYANDFEIWVYDIEMNQKTLLTRISNNIQNILWHPSNNYILYSTDKSVNIIELDKREKYNITKLIEFNEIKNLQINKKGDTIYFYTIIGNREGLYKLAIQ